MPNKTKQNTKNSTEQICSQPLYKSQTTHHTQPTPKKPSGWLRGQPPPTGGRRSHGVEREPDSVSARKTFHAQPTKHAPTPTTHCRAVNTCRHKKTTQHNPNSHAELFPTNWAPSKGGDPAAPSGTATLLRLRPNRQSHLRPLPPQKRLGHGLRVLPTFVT